MPVELMMGSTFLSLHYHLVFSTKGRYPFIQPQWQQKLYQYMGGTIKGLDGFPQAIGGIADHLHLLVGLKATHCLSDFMRELKKSSSVWMHDTMKVETFAWQEGYAAFTVSSTSRQGVKRYIANQAEHHRSKSYREELIEMLEKAGVTFDPKFLE